MLAHAPNQSYIFLRIYDHGVGGHFEINSDDLSRVLGIKLQRELTVEDIEPYLAEIHRYYQQHVQFSSAAGSHAIAFEDSEILSIDLGDFVRLYFSLQNMEESPQGLDIDYSVLFDIDRTHLGLQVIEYHWEAGIHNNEANVSLIFSPDQTSQHLDLSGSSVMNGFTAMVKSGTHHIYIGLDHILFLLALLLPAVVRRDTGDGLEIPGSGTSNNFFPGFLKPYASAWQPVDGFKTAFIYVIKIVTFFTIAHTITLSLAALEIIKLPSALVESVIALSIALAAFHNIYPLLSHGKEWIIAFVFGLFHGFGFASVLGDIGLSGDYMVLSLLGFNLGVEVGQIMIVCIIFPVLFLMRKTIVYRPVLVYGSMFLILVALSWFFDRSLGVDLPLDNFVEKVYAKILNKIV